MVPAAKRNGELIADFATKRAALGKAECGHRRAGDRKSGKDAGRQIGRDPDRGAGSSRVSTLLSPSVRSGGLADGANRPVRRNPFPRGMRQDRGEIDDPGALVDRGRLYPWRSYAGPDLADDIELLGSPGGLARLAPFTRVAERRRPSRLFEDRAGEPVFPVRRIWSRTRSKPAAASL